MSANDKPLLDNFTGNPGGSIFWTLVILLNLIGLTYFGIWSFHNENIRAAIIFSIFGFMIIVGLILSRLEAFNSGTWAQNCMSFTLGFLIWIFISGTEKSVLSIMSIGENQLFANVTSELPAFLEFVMNVFVIPSAEELLWMIGIPFALIGLMELMGNRLNQEWLKDDFVQILIVVVVSGTTFAAFHVGKLFASFLVIAFIFRALTIVSVFADMSVNWLPGITLVPAFALGAHIGNNLGNTGISHGFTMLNANLFPIGLLIYILFLAIFVTAGNQIILGLDRARRWVFG